MTVEDHIVVAKLIRPTGLKKRGVGNDVDRAVAAIPEGLGVEPGPGQSPRVFLCRPPGSDDEDHMITKRFLEWTLPQGAFPSRRCWRWHYRPPPACASQPDSPVAIRRRQCDLDRL